MEDDPIASTGGKAEGDPIASTGGKWRTTPIASTGGKARATFLSLVFTQFDPSNLTGTHLPISKG